ncbi:23S rRNA (uracil(1939)-C(5))-methyltransferase RlmD [Zoogloea sp.]|uniref:23S rRNA (uracil(1939)-C(5))-methyltransferase RlmD n=1 Tax=Zoogloea sp. TaxID=49181 RepID=UPI0035AEC640
MSEQNSAQAHTRFQPEARGPLATIESLDHEGRGVARVEGKTIFIEGALPGEVVTYRTHRAKPNYEVADVDQVLRASAQRVAPPCPHFGVCGGCSMQHLEANAQVAAKQRVLESALWHIGRLKPEILYPAIVGPTWGYRYRSRLTVRLVPSKGGLLIGFHQRRSSYVAPMESCAILPPHVSALVPRLRDLIAGLSIPDRVPQIEIAVGEGITVLVFRHLQPFSAADQARLAAFADAEGVQVWVQPNGPDSARRLHPRKAPGLAYTLPEFGVSMAFRPTDFTQVNMWINRVLMRRAMQLLDPQPGERIADLFCGLGNFSLPIASRGAHVVGVEGSAALVRRAGENAAANGLAQRSEFYEANLFEATEDSIAALGHLDKMLIDPPREGAIAVVKALGPDAPRRIVYVSCNPATLARDAAVLFHEKGYALKGAGIANMFPHTSHVESIALFER